MNDLLGSVKPEGIGRYRANEVTADIELGPISPGPDTKSTAALEAESKSRFALFGWKARSEPEPTPVPTEDNSDLSLDDFYRDVSETKRIFAVMNKKLKALQSAHERGKTASRAQDMKEIRQQMQDITTDVGKLANDAKTRLENLDTENTSLRSKYGANSCQDRTRTSITNSIRKKLKDILSEFSEVRARIHEEYRETVSRRFYTVNGTKLDDEQLENMIESGESESIFRSAIVNAGRGQILDTVAEIQERHEAFRELERKLMMLHQIFLDMAVLVEAQGEMLDNIETNVGQAVEYVEQGNEALGQAKSIQKNTRKWACYAIW
eukprot:CAMPEP_0198208072 /NCGR_PEP_ID=MMETSP1445-20131203/11466_1 /TAXON_ID=36898 /ORGANISM="Pyramimonas sp., Strain CCMP2087" /LENGTH=322 /DNA_ID=CAMNT_0043881331 /DNA_START=365 /DNA_END=1330 /DNA_ORIENTATION=+